MFGAQILFVSYGLNIEDDADPHLVRGEKALQSLSELGRVGSYLGVTTRISSRPSLL